MNSNSNKTERKVSSYNSIIKENSKFYVSVNDNIQFLLNPTELAIFLKVIHINNIGKNKQSKEYFALTTRLSKRTIDKTLEQLVRYCLIHVEKNGKTNNIYTLNLEVIEGIYKSLNSIKEIKGKQRWCEIYIQNTTTTTTTTTTTNTTSSDSNNSTKKEFTPCMDAEFAGLGVQNLHVGGAEFAGSGVQNLHPNKEDINKEDINKKNINKENFREGEFEVEEHIEFNSTGNLVSDTSSKSAVEETVITDINNIEDMNNRNLDNLDADKTDLENFEVRNDNSIQQVPKASENGSKEVTNALSNETSNLRELYSSRRA